MKQMIEKFDGIDKGEFKLGQAADGSCEDFWWSPVCLTLCAPLSGLPLGLDFTLKTVDCNYDGHCNTPQIFIEGDNVVLFFQSMYSMISVSPAPTQAFTMARIKTRLK